MIYGKSWCPYTIKVKKTLNDFYPQIKFAYVDTDIQDEGDELQEAANEKSGMDTVPQIWICGKKIGGIMCFNFQLKFTRHIMRFFSQAKENLEDFTKKINWKQ